MLPEALPYQGILNDDAVNVSFISLVWFCNSNIYKNIQYLVKLGKNPQPGNDAEDFMIIALLR